VTFTPTKILSFEDFLAGYQDQPRYELADGELIDMDPTGPHETVSGKLATKIGIAITTEQLLWFIPRTCLIRPFSDTATARRPDIVVLDETALGNEPFWEKNQSLLWDVRSNSLLKSLVRIGKRTMLEKWKNTRFSAFLNIGLGTIGKYWNINEL
jgi:Uma2 family endonuclease